MADRTAEGPAGFWTRRGFIRVMAASAAALTLPACSREERALGFSPGAKRVTPFITPNKDFYLVAVDPSFRPSFDVATVKNQWSLTLRGLDGAQRAMGYDHLTGNARHTVPYTFECIGNRVGGQLVGNARWRVMSLKQLLRSVPGGLGSARSVMFEGLDDFYSRVSLERALDDYAFIAVEMNGEPLPGAHGFPARVILPDLYGMKQPRWLRRISLSENPHSDSYWERRGWGGEVPIKTMSRLDPRGRLTAGAAATLTGVALAGKRGIRKVEVSLDDGKSWQPCELVTGEQPDVWSLWRYVWRKPTAGRYRLKVRATDGGGRLQTAKESSSYPDGASGYDVMDVRVG